MAALAELQSSLSEIGTRIDGCGKRLDRLELGSDGAPKAGTHEVLDLPVGHSPRRELLHCQGQGAAGQEGLDYAAVFSVSRGCCLSPGPREGGVICEDVTSFVIGPARWGVCKGGD
jgi:hypothetical protein